MKEAADDTSEKWSQGYPLPRVMLAVGIAVAVHGALLGATMFSASSKAPEVPAASAKGDAKTKPADGKSPAAPPAANAPVAPDKLAADGPATESKAPADEPKKADKPAESGDELKLDMK